MLQPPNELGGWPLWQPSPHPEAILPPLILKGHLISLNLGMPEGTYHEFKKTALSLEKFQDI